MTSSRRGPRAEAAAYAGLVGVALALRLVGLGDRAFHHDESMHAYFSWLFSNGRGYRYDPLLHGPVRDFLTAAAYLLVGAGDFAARLAPAVLGSAVVALPYFLRRQLGRTGALAVAALLCLSPAYLYYSRFQREDIYVATMTLALTVAVFRFLERPRPWHPSLILGLLAVSFATKETTYIAVFVAGTFFILVSLWELRRLRRGEPVAGVSVLGCVRVVGRDAWLWGVATFLTVFTVLFTTFFTNPQGLRDGLVESIRYWLSQQPVGRGGQPWFYYLVLLGAYEWCAILLGATGVVVALRRPTLLRLYLVWTFALTLAIYTWASEKMPWLLLHPLLPLLILAGIGFETMWQHRRRLRGAVGLAATGAAAAYTLWASTAATYRHPADPAEILVFTQTSPDVVRVRERLASLDSRVAAATGQPLTVEVDATWGMGWPWSWYLRDFRGASLVEMSDPGYVPRAQALLVGEPNRFRLAPRLRGFTRSRFRHRWWWVQDYSAVTPAAVARWLVFRDPWSPKGSLDAWLYLRRDLRLNRAVERKE